MLFKKTVQHLHTAQLLLKAGYELKGYRGSQLIFDKDKSEYLVAIADMEDFLSNPDSYRESENVTLVQPR